MRRLLVAYLLYRLARYLYGWTRTPLHDPQQSQWMYFWYQIASGYPPGELDHWK